MDEEEAKKNKAKFTETAKTRIKTGLILNELVNKIKYKYLNKKFKLKFKNN